MDPNPRLPAIGAVAIVSMAGVLLGLAVDNMLLTVGCLAAMLAATVAYTLESSR